MERGHVAEGASARQYSKPSQLSTPACGEITGPKKTEQTDLIFENLQRENKAADNDLETVRISIDTKATVNIGPYSRGGCSRGLCAVAAADHDMMVKKKLVPGGILEMKSGRPFLFFTESCKTSDFMMDGIELWWSESRERLAGIKRLVINMDNGPECSGHRSQFLQRMVDFSDREKLEIRLIYYPPYHSKYNGIERYWGGLERSWNGYLLDSVEAVLQRASHFCWKTIQTVSHLLDGIYQKGVTLCRDEKRDLETRLFRSKALPWWDISIQSYVVVQ